MSGRIARVRNGNSGPIVPAQCWITECPNSARLRVLTTPDTVYPVRHELSQLWQVAMNVHVLVKNTHHVDSDIKSQVED
jgi:hypothetical protein